MSTLYSRIDRLTLQPTSHYILLTRVCSVSYLCNFYLCVSGRILMVFSYEIATFVAYSYHRIFWCLASILQNIIVV